MDLYNFNFKYIPFLCIGFHTYVLPSYFKSGMCHPVASAHAWFLEISFVCDVCMCACVPPPFKAINN